MSRTLRMFSTEHPYEGGMGDVTQQDVPDAWFIDREEAYGAHHAASPLEPREISGIGQDVAAAMFGGSQPARSPTRVAMPTTPVFKAAVAANQLMTSLGKETWHIPTSVWNNTSWAVFTGSPSPRNPQLDPRMTQIARQFNVGLYRITPYGGGNSYWVFTPASRVPITARTTGLTAVGLNRAV